MRVLVTGGAGFIGSHIVDRLIARGHSVTVLDNLSTGRREHIPLVADFIHFDVTDPFLPSKLSGLRFDAVVHHAAQASVPRSLIDPEFDAQVNLVGTMNLVSYACRSRVRRFIFASSAAVYGNPRAIPVSEDAPTNPLSPYAVSKLAAEDYLRHFSCDPGLNFVILRYANVYGPRQNIRGEASVICSMMNQMLAGKPLAIHGDGKQTRDFVYVTDVAEANLLALRTDLPPGIYNVGTGTQVSIQELHHLLVGPNNPPLHTPPRPGDVRYSALDNTAIRSELGWQPSVPFVEGLARTWRYLVSLFDSAYPVPSVLASQHFTRPSG
jgi:UDP-glucose 4-epimerase